MSNNRNNRNQVAVIEPTRMKMPANVAEDYSLTEDSWRALVDAVFPNAQSVGAVTMALAYCKKNHLDIFQRPVHIVPMWNGNRMIETVWPGIAQLRITAQRQEEYAGYDDCEFGPMIENVQFKGKAKGRNDSTYDVSATVTYPEWAQFTVYKMLHGQRVALKGPKVYWMEAFSNRATAGGKCPNEMWATRPIGQLEKCAEAAAWRRAFPDVLGNEYAMEEMEGRDLSTAPAIEGEYVEVSRDEKPVAKEKPRQQDYDNASDHVKQEERPKEEAREEPAKEEKPAEPKHPPGWNEETAQLEGEGMPNDSEGWSFFLEILRKRLERLHKIEHVDQLQDAQQHRIDAAPPGTQTEALELFADAIARVKDAPADDEGENEGGKSEEASD